VEFIKYIDLDFSKAYLGCQSTARNVLKDHFMSWMRRDIKTNEFKIMHGNVYINPAFVFKLKIADDRSNGPKAYSLSYRLKEIPDEFKKIILSHKREICEYLGDNFLYEPTLVFRTLNIPSELETYDVYSNIWHQDSHDGDRLLKIFILLMDVSEDDGPFTYLDRATTLKYWTDLAERWSFSKFAKIPKFKEEIKATGRRGDYLIINTASCMHRATIPREFRDMMQITLYPSWRVASDRQSYNF